MLTRIFEWLDAHPGSYWAVAAPATALFFAYVFRAIRRPAASRLTGAFDFAALFLFLLAWRWPFLLSAEEYNPDESQFVAGAITLARDPVFFRAVDGTTSGPLNFYALLPFHWLGLPLDYFTARIAAVLLNCGALALTLRLLADRFGPAVAWLAILPAAVMFGTTWQGEFVHYSSELVPVLLLAAAAWTIGSARDGTGPRLAAGAALAALAPWAKLQAAPLSAILIVWALCRAVTALPRKLPLLAVAAAAAAPAVLAAIALAAVGELGTAWRRYILHNLVYVDHGLPVAEALRRMLEFAKEDWRMILFIGSVTATGTALLVACLTAVRRRPALLWPAVGLLAAAVVAVVTPRREILHYTIFLVTPLSLLLGVGLGGCWSACASRRARLLLAGAVAATTVLPLLVTRARQPVPAMFGEFARHWRHPRTSTGEIIHALAQGRGSLAVWGWAQRLFVEAGLPQGTRDALTYGSLWPSARQQYYRDTYLADLRRNRPVVFVDVVGTDGYIFQDRARHGHEVYPPLAEEIRANYVLVRDTSASRIYLRKDRAAGMDLSRLDLDAVAARGRVTTAALPPPSASNHPLEWRKLGSTHVLVLQPPTEAEWELDPQVRQLSLEFGFVPEAFERGTTNGAVLLAELRAADGHRRIVFQRAIRPRQVARDRGRQSTEITLPPFAAGARLILRTAAGEHGDAAWDWVYVSRLVFRTSARFLPQQFPGFNRVPESVDAPYSSLDGAGDARELSVHPPAVFRFRIDGGERVLRFDYGLHPGAYSDGGESDGAVYRVQLLAGDAPPRTVFERHLRPAEAPADRGPQTAAVALAGARPGDLLVLSLDAGPEGSAAWDWTYLRNVVLE